MKEKISIIGAGNWGTTQAVFLARKGLEVELHSVFDAHNRKMAKDRENKLYLKGTKFPAKLKVNPSLKETLKNQIIVIAIPVKFIRKVVRKIGSQAPSLKNKVFLSLSKGIEVTSLKRPSQIMEEELEITNVAVLSAISLLPYRIVIEIHLRF